MTTILLIRHGLNNWVGKRLAGRAPGVHLNEIGLKQAQTISEVLQEVPISAIYCSPLARAVETAHPLAQIHSLPINLKEELQEINFGNWQGKTIKQLRRLKLWKSVQLEPEKFRFPEGESFSEAQQRLSGFIETIFVNHDKEDIVACFSHSDSIRLILAHFLGLPLKMFQKISVDTASISVIYRQKGNIYVPYINQIVDKPFGLIFKKE